MSALPIAQLDFRIPYDPPVEDALALFRGLKVNTRGRVIEWIKYGCPADFGMIDNVLTIREGAAPFRELVSQITDPVHIEQILAEAQAIDAELRRPGQ